MHECISCLSCSDGDMHVKHAHTCTCQIYLYLIQYYLLQMMKTLAFFMTSGERKLSRLLTKDTRELEYLRDLFVQGFVHSGTVRDMLCGHFLVIVVIQVEKLPMKTIHLRLSAFAPTLIDMNSLVVSVCVYVCVCVCACACVWGCCLCLCVC